MTKKDYELIAAAIRRARVGFDRGGACECGVTLAAACIARELKREDNPRFDENRFYRACTPAGYTWPDERK